MFLTHLHLIPPLVQTLEGVDVSFYLQSAPIVNGGSSGNKGIQAGFQTRAIGQWMNGQPLQLLPFMNSLTPYRAIALTPVDTFV